MDFLPNFPGDEPWREGPITLEKLKQAVPSLSVSADLEVRGKVAFVRVISNSGSGNYLAMAGMDMAWLRKKAVSEETKGHFTIYKFKFDD
jgi:hypothetical protein